MESLFEVEKLKHGDIIDLLDELDRQLVRSRNTQTDISETSKQIEGVGEYAYIGIQVRGHRRYLHWRQRRYGRSFFTLYDDHGRYLLNSVDNAWNAVEEIEQRRIQCNYLHQMIVQSREMLLQLKNNMDDWRKVKRQR